MTSDAEPIRDNNTTPNTSPKPGEQTQQANPNISTTSGSAAPPPAKTHCQITCKPERDAWDKFKNGAEIVGIILLAVYTVYTIKMYCANKQAADAATNAVSIAEQTMRLDQRAWVAVTAVNSTKPEVANKFIYSVHFVDTGKTPASNVFIHPGDELLDLGQHPNFSLDTNPIRLGVLSPGSERTYENAPNRGTTKVTKMLRGDLTFLKSKTLSVHGKITYDDIFGCHHWITYCSYLKDDWSGYAFCSENNDTDQTDKPCRGN